MSDITDRYVVEDGVSIIEIHLNAVQRLFNSLDPAPFRDKDLDSDAEEYIVGAVDDFPLSAPLKLVLYLPADQIGLLGPDAIGDAIHNYFAYAVASEGRKLRAVFREGRTSLLLGSCFLILCITLRQLLLALEPGTLGQIAAEGLLISGWVAMWRPINVFLYGWWPTRHLGLVYRKLSSIPVDVRPLPVAAPGPQDHR
jgi:hypothetical protein